MSWEKYAVSMVLLLTLWISMLFVAPKEVTSLIGSVAVGVLIARISAWFGQEVSR